MFDEVLGMATLCSSTFRDGVRDAFGVALAADVLDPILKEVGALRTCHSGFQRQALSINTVLADARAIQGKDQGRNR